MPHALWLVPGWQWLPEQQPVHELESHTHSADTHVWPPAQVPVEHLPPQPSLPPQVAPLQLGTHPPTSHRSMPPDEPPLDPPDEPPLDPLDASPMASPDVAQ